MTKPLRIAVADDEPDMRDYYARILPRLGHQVVVVAGTGAELVLRCRQEKPDLVISDIKMPDMDGIEAAGLLYQEAPVPFVLVSAYHNPELIRRAEADHIMAYLIKPIKQADLEPAIALAMRRFEQMQELRKEAADLRETPEDRQVIERALGAVMKRAASSESEAFRHLLQVAGARNLRLVEAARLVLSGEEDFPRL
jgi:response regulator NasT